MSTVAAPSLQAYQAWADPARLHKPAVRPAVPAPDPEARRSEAIVFNLSPEAEKLVAQQGGTTAKMGAAHAAEAAGHYQSVTETGAGRREAPFAHRDDAVRFEPPGRLVDLSV